jgi:hypothetical protein
MPVADYGQYCEMLDRARKGRFAYLAINVTSRRAGRISRGGAGRISGPRQLDGGRTTLLPPTRSLVESVRLPWTPRTLQLGW